MLLECVARTRLCFGGMSQIRRCVSYIEILERREATLNVQRESFPTIAA